MGGGVITTGSEGDEVELRMFLSVVLVPFGTLVYRFFRVILWILDHGFLGMGTYWLSARYGFTAYLSSREEE